MNTTDEGFSFSFHKNYKLGPTYPRLAIFSLRELHQTSPSALRAETSSRYQSDPPEKPTLTHRRSGCQLDLLSVNFDFRNVIFQPMVPMVFPFVWAKYKWNLMRSLQALLSSAHRGFAARSHVLERLASLAQIGERAHWVDYMIRNGPVGQAGLFCLVAMLAWSVL